jgi:hypothetical protein
MHGQVTNEITLWEVDLEKTGLNHSHNKFEL